MKQMMLLVWIGLSFSATVAAEQRSGFDRFFDSVWTAVTGDDGSQSKATAPPETLAAVATPAPRHDAFAGQATRFGFTPFPYDATAEALTKTQQLILKHSTIYGIQLDNGVPWREAFEQRPWPQPFRSDDWDRFRTNVPTDRPLYVSIAPLADDRRSLAAAAAGSSMPSGFASAALDDSRIKTAYLNYVRRVVAAFEPDYLNLGQEAGELAKHDPARWRQFMRLYKYVRSAIKREHPKIQIGISFTLQLLMLPQVAEASRPLVEASDYVGLSFFPYASRFYETSGARPLPKGAAAWREPLAWVRRYTSKPIAIAETAYATRDVNISKWNLHLPGSEQAQRDYVRDLMAIARRDRYPFVIWFAVVDYGRLYDRLLQDQPVALIWRDTGFYDRDLRPKPALSEWTRGLSSSSGSPVLKPVVRSLGAPTPVPSTAVSGVRVEFDSAAAPFSCMGKKPGLETAADGSKIMRWDFRYTKEWAWCLKPVSEGRFKGTSEFSLAMRSDRDGPIFLQLEEASGETFFVIVRPTRDWQVFHYRLNQLSPDPEKRRDGRLQPSSVHSLLVADGGGAENGKSGARTVWLRDWTFR